jgi:phosphoglucosamine mutase
MKAVGVEVVETAVGDRYVLEALERGGYSIGGEQSGHVILPDLATTGDGLLTGALLLDVVRRGNRPLAELARTSMTRLPQVLVNVQVASRDPEIVTTIAPAIAATEARLGATGRVLVRPSGTEPLIRVMVEAATPDEANAAARELVDAVLAVCGRAG